MKTTKLLYPLMIALAVTLAATGCKRKAYTTPLPGTTPRNVQDQGGGPTLTPGPSIEDGGKVGGGPLPDNWTVDMMNQDRAAYAAYTIHFAYDSAVIRKTEQSNLQSVAQGLAGDKNAYLLIEGNCDERGTEEYNRALGERRALAAREALAKLGVDPMRVRTESFGKDKPLDPAHDEAAWKQNRRDDFVLLHPKTGGAAPAPGSMGGS